MGNICTCLGNTEGDDESILLEPTETRSARAASIEKAVNNYHSIIDDATSNFISSQPFRFVKMEQQSKSEEEIQLLRCKIQELSLNSSLLESPSNEGKRIIPGIYNNGNGEVQSSTVSKEKAILNILSNHNVAYSDSNIDITAERIALNASKSSAMVNSDTKSAFVCLKACDDCMHNDNDR